ncbi:hypothetical protein DFH08DRAFT_101660 [Mycena albidolilacea]|uniref:Uncharacterized protein n=1 Tax=Mycena albidolilacea TaxID=1033008 RepID=A0AAD6YYE8_9AGAR|nr:hypothetical protein DFH08DRAFT_101660 [Mycena albidolilacea]
MDVVIAHRRERSRLDTIIPLDLPDSETAIIHSMDPYQFHERIYHSIPPAHVLKAEWNLGAVMYYPLGSRLKGAVEIASMTDADTYVLPLGTEMHGEILEDGWTRYSFYVWTMAGADHVQCRRYNSCDVYDTALHFSVALEEPDSWLCQANHIFSRLQITSNYEDYALVYLINCKLKISAPTNDPPQGYLFVSNLTNPISFRWPEAYWSLDSSGANDLTMHQAIRLGFPSISWSRRVRIRFWDDGVYAAVRKFHEEKGFDPDSQDLVRQMRYPLFQISDELYDEE